ncbi:hypothetical protein GGR50DRAFT_561121 [Xylaria sp. CBS 124048]|nr:hypothetical protein GGR50DRAFT_561121 [Xylaria sp. CBS 124048]
MNRICHSSFGTLEAVLNLANFNGEGHRRLVHFTRLRATGEWTPLTVISETPKSGGSIIQNVSKPYAKAEHGDFEVLVLEQNGAVRHYTRDNSDADNDFCWRLSGTVNTISDSGRPNTQAIEAAPLVQTQTSMSPLMDGTCLETAILEEGGSMVHYRRPQYRGSGALVAEYMTEWYRGTTIVQGATGPACLYQPDRETLMALVPTLSGIKRYRHHERSNSWMSIGILAGKSGPGFVYSITTPSGPVLRAIYRDGYHIDEKVCNEPNWDDTFEGVLPASFNHIRDTLYHRVYRTVPISIASQSMSGLGDSSNAEAIVFHASGTGYQDAWMVLHWSLPAGHDEWVVSSVVVPNVIGMPI